MSTGDSQVPAVGAALERCVSALLRWSTRAEVQRSMRAGRTPLSPTDVWLLCRLVDDGPSRLSELAAWQSVDKSTMTTQVGRLERQALVSRRPDPSDRRAVLVRATPKGRRLQRSNVVVAQRVFDGLVADWPEADKEELARLLTRLTDLLDR
jgi:DNA-binding MarR family transcriptional regulator